MSYDSYWWMNILDTVSSFIWDPAVVEKVEEESATMADTGGPVRNKSTLYNLLAANQAKVDKEAKIDEEPREEADEKINENGLSKDEEDSELKKNSSTLYKIISSQNIALKNPEEIEDIEYHEIVENRHFEKENLENIAENALYYVEEEEKGKIEHTQERKTSFFEITLSNTKIKRSQSLVPGERPQSSPDVVTMVKKNMPKSTDDLGHLSSISFSFLEQDREQSYDVVDESKVVDISERGYVPMNGSKEEIIYSSPRSSVNLPSREVSPNYVGPDRKVQEDHGLYISPDREDPELFYAAAEIVMRRRPSTPFERQADYEDVDMEDRELPPLPSKVEEEYADVDVQDYVRHRDTHPKKLDTLKGKAVNLVKVRSKLNRAWRSVKSMIKEKEISQEVKTPEPETPESPYSLSEYSDYFSEKSKPSVDDGTISVSDVDAYSDAPSSRADFLENGLTTLLRRRKDGATSPFRKSRHFPEVSLRS